jgi:hypothetical protein
MNFFEKRINGQWDDDFIVNPPGRPLNQQLLF